MNTAIKTNPSRKPIPPEKLFIDGKWCDAQHGATMTTSDPTTEEVITTVAKGGPADADLAVRAASRAFDPSTQIGPMATKAEYDKVLRYVEAGKQSGAKLVAGGGTRKINGKGLFIEGTIFANATNDMKISREEIFGPVLPVIPFDTEEEAIRIANDTPYGLASGIQTGNLSRALRLADKIKAGTVWINTRHPNGPFGGYILSGYGREQGAEALESYTQYKTIWANLAS
jgi:aldehyde dehydrogenase (NAD+)